MSSCETIKQRLQDKWDSPEMVPEFGKRGIMFWYDPDLEFSDCLNELNLKAGYDDKPVKIHRVDSFFGTKYLLEHEDKDSHYLLYLPFAHPTKHHENRLIDIELYATEFKADSLAMAMDECGIVHMQWYDTLKEHARFFSAQKRKQIFRDLYMASKQQDNMESIYTCMLAACVGSKRNEFDDILINLFKNGLNEEENESWTTIKKSNLDGKFWELILEYYDYGNENPSLTNFWYSMYFGAIAHQQPKSGLLKSYGDYANNINQSQAFHTLDYWIKRTDFSDTYEQIIDIVQSQKDVVSRANQMNVDDMGERRNITISPLYEKVALRYCKQKLLSPVERNKINDCIGYRKQYSYWYTKFEADYKFIEHVLGLLDQIEMARIEQKSVEDMRNYYTTTAWKIDYKYRNALCMYDLSEHQTEWQDTLEDINNRYTQIVRDLNDRRYNLLQSEGYTADRGKGNMPKQWNFWNDYVAKNTGESAPYHKAIVIISDALRYEVAEQLKEELSSETRGDSELQSMWGVVPSFTQLGMASLLPNQKIEFTDLLKNQTVIVDGISTAGIENRKKILQGQGSHITAIKRDDFSQLKTKEEQAPFMTNYDIVYIYHNVIDTGGEKDEHSIPRATKDCVEDLIKIIKRCGDTFNFTQIFVTSDHGYLYQRDKLSATDKSRRVSSDDVLQDSSRFAILQESKTDTASNDLQISLSYLGNNELFVNTPWADMRYQKQGSSKHFAHGGATLQEMVIPVLWYHHKQSRSYIQSTYDTFTEIQLISLPKIITTNEITLNVFQTEPLIDKMKAGNYNIVILDSTGSEVSRPMVFVADNKEAQPDQRISKITISLLPNTFSRSENYTINIQAKGQDNNNYTQAYSTKISIGITDEFF